MGGITIAQKLNTAGLPDMPESAIASGCIDFILSPEDIALELQPIAQIDRQDTSLKNSSLFRVLDRHFFRIAAGQHFGGVEETGHGQMERDILLALVLPEPAVNPGRGRGE